jgi:mannosyltransferase
MWNFWIQSLWRDEAFSYLMIQKPWIVMLDLILQDKGNPLYYVLLKMWTGLWGTSELALRSLSVGFAVACGVVGYFILRRVAGLDSKWSKLAIGWLVISPVVGYYAFEARTYTLFGLLALVAGYVWFKEKRWLFVICGALGLYSHWYMLFFLGSCGLWEIVIRRHWRNLIPLAVTVGLFLPWVGLVLQHTQTTIDFWIRPLPKFAEVIGLGVSYFIADRDDYYFVAHPTEFLTIMVLFSITVASLLIKTWRHLSLGSKYLWWCAIVPTLIVVVLSYITKPLYLPRYMIFSHLFLCLSLGATMVSYLHRSSKKGWLVIILMVMGVVWYHFRAYPYRLKPDVRQAVHEAMTVATQDRLLVKNILDYQTAQYYFDPARTYLIGYNYEDLPWYVGRILINPDQVGVDFQMGAADAILEPVTIE